MSTSFVEQCPRELVERLYEVDRAQKEMMPVVLSAADRDLALNWLRRMLVDFEALDEHVAVLQQLYHAPFRYSRPRGSQLNLDLTPPVDVSGFRHHERLPDERVSEILNHGVGCLANEGELRQLLLNPVALYDLFDAIDEIQPDYWLGVMTELAQPLFTPGAASAEAAPAPRAELPGSSPSPAAVDLNERSLMRLQECLVAAIREAQFQPEKEPDSTPIAPPPAQSPRSNAWQYAWATVAIVLVAFMAGGMVGFLGHGASPPDSSRPFEVLLASAKVELSAGRGSADALRLSIATPKSGFATIVALFDNEEQLIQTGDVRVSSGESNEISVSRSDAKQFVVIITEQPSLRVIDRADYAGRKFRADKTSLSEFESHVRQYLAEQNYRWVAFAEAVNPRPATKGG